MEKFLSRKFTLATLTMLITSGLTAAGVLGEAAYISALGLSVGGYMAANYFQYKAGV